MRIVKDDIRDGESGRDYVRRISIWHRLFLLTVGVALFTAAIAYLAVVLTTVRQMVEQLPLWLNFYLVVSVLLLALATSVVMELRERRRR